MRTRSALALIVVLFVGACNARFAAPISPPSTATFTPTPVPVGYGYASDKIAQLSDGSTAIHLSGGRVTHPDGSGENIHPFWITAALISNQQYFQCVEAGGCSLPEPNNNPGYHTCWWGIFPYPCFSSYDVRGGGNASAGVFSVTGVTLDQASDYCKWMGGELPSSAQTNLSDKEIAVLLANLFQTNGIDLANTPTPDPNVSACDFVPAGTDGCPATTSSVTACDFAPAGTAGCPTKIPDVSACDFAPAGTAGCPTEAPASACDFAPAGTAGCPTTQPSSVTACDFAPAGTAGCPTEVPASACDFVPAGSPGCPPTPASPNNDILVGLLNGILFGPNFGSLGTFSYDSSQARGGSYKNPLGEIIKVNGKTHFGNVGFKCVIQDVKVYAPYCQMTSYVPNTRGNYPNLVCPNVSIESKGQFCSSKSPFVNVEIKGADLISVDPPANCTEDTANSSADSTRMICTGPSSTTFSIHAQSQCSAPADWKPEAVCLNGYSYDAAKNICNYNKVDTGASACPGGFTYSSEEKCCVAAKDYQPTCAPGYYHSTLGCVSYDSTYLNVDQTLTLAACGGASGGQPGCNLSCPQGMHPDATCSACTGKP